MSCVFYMKQSMPSNLGIDCSLIPVPGYPQWVRGNQLNCLEFAGPSYSMERRTIKWRRIKGWNKLTPIAANGGFATRSISQDRLRITERVEKTSMEGAQPMAGISRLTLTPIASEKPVVILIVDDNIAIRRFIRRAISRPNREIHECADGIEALELYPKILPDLTLMDIRMPRMDGLTATRAILGKSPEAKIVVVTDYDIKEIRVAAFAAGAMGYVLKDNLTDVEAVISRLVE